MGLPDDAVKGRKSRLVGVYDTKLLPLLDQPAAGLLAK